MAFFIVLPFLPLGPVARPLSCCSAEGRLDELGGGLDGAEGVELAPALALTDVDVVAAVAALHAGDVVAVDCLDDLVDALHGVVLSGRSAYVQKSSPRRGSGGA